MIALSTVFMRRLWCRAVCPLGAIYSLIGRYAFIRRTVEKCIFCLKCKNDCRMGAIRDDLSYSQGECVLCMDCVYDCPEHVTEFKWMPRPSKKVETNINTPKSEPVRGITRRQFLLLTASSIFMAGFKFKVDKREGLVNVIRPPAALKEGEFLNRCIRCGNCMKVCITNGLQPVLLQAGLGGIWTPQLVPEIGYCEYQCTLCGDTCPTQAIPSLTVDEKRRVRLGLAEIDRSICIPWAYGKECIVCQEHCPVDQKAIKLELEATGNAFVSKPYIDTNLCIGCGICQNKCPVRPVRAIKVLAINSDRR